MREVGQCLKLGTKYIVRKCCYAIL